MFLYTDEMMIRAVTDVMVGLAGLYGRTYVLFSMAGMYYKDGLLYSWTCDTGGTNYVIRLAI